MVSADSPHRLICARKGSPLLIGLGIEENFIASDVSALLPVTQRVMYLEEGDVADIGLLSVDIDGNDYWVWQAIDTISPRIVICEYNSHFGPTAEVSTPYEAAFVRDTAHFSKIYYGASIAALCALGARKGYSLVASNSAGNNVFFVRNDLLGSLPALSPAQAYRRSQFREFHDEGGRLTFDDFETRLRKISHLPLYNLKANALAKLSDIPGILVPDTGH